MVTVLIINEKLFGMLEEIKSWFSVCLLIPLMKLSHSIAQFFPHLRHSGELYAIQANPGRVITKFNFVSLFVQAWSKAVIPANIISGFRTCGVYPLDTSAIHVAKARPKQVLVEIVILKIMMQMLETTLSQDDSRNKFSSEQEMLFQRRYEEGYNLFIDADYVRWLRLHHLEVTPTEQASVSLLDAFTDITPISPVPIDFLEDDVNDELWLSPIPRAMSSELQLTANSETQLYTNSEQQLLLPASAASSLPSMSNQTTTIITTFPPGLYLPFE